MYVKFLNIFTYIQEEEREEKLSIFNANIFNFISVTNVFVSIIFEIFLDYAKYS